jgi:hypothetical protein
MYHQSNLTMPDMSLMMGMKPDASPPTPRSLRLIGSSSGTMLGQSNDELRNAVRMSHPGSSGDYMSGSLPHHGMGQGAYGVQDRLGAGGLGSGSNAAAMAAAAAKKKGIKSSLGRLFSKKEKVCPPSFKVLLIKKVSTILFEYRVRERMSFMTTEASTVTVVLQMNPQSPLHLVL